MKISTLQSIIKRNSTEIYTNEQCLLYAKRMSKELGYDVSDKSIAKIRKTIKELVAIQRELKEAINYKICYDQFRGKWKRYCESAILETDFPI